MTICYSNGYQIEGVLLSREEHSMRVAGQGFDDILHLNEIDGTWITEDCEPVRVEYTWAKNRGTAAVTLDDCICPKELAAKLLHMLFSGDSDAEAKATAMAAAASAPVCHQVI